MKTIMLIVSVFASGNLLAADIYEFKYEAPVVKPAPAKPVPRAASTTSTTRVAAPATDKTKTTAPDPAQTNATHNGSVVQQAHECSAGALCNDL